MPVVNKNINIESNEQFDSRFHKAIGSNNRVIEEKSERSSLDNIKSVNNKTAHDIKNETVTVSFPAANNENLIKNAIRN